MALRWKTTLRQLSRRRRVRLLAVCVCLLLVKVLLLFMWPNFYRRFLSFRYAKFNEVPSPQELEDAETFLLKYRWPTFRPSYRTPDLVITLVTVHRNSVRQQYIHYTLQTLLLGLGDEIHSANVKIVVCNANQASGLDGYLKEIRKHLLVLKVRPYTIKVRDAKDTSWRFEKERHDYVSCLNKTLTHLPNVKHFLILEDDAPIRLSGAPFLSTLRYFIDQAGQRGIRRFAFMKLYHPPRLLGYLQPEWDRHLECVAIVIILITVLRLSLWLSGANNRQWVRSMKDSSWQYIIVCLVILLYVLDRYWLLELRSLSKYFHLMVPAPFCCTPGIVFQRQSAIEAVDFIGGVRSDNQYGKDAALYDYYRKSGLPAWYIQPNLVEHIGLKSTLHSNVIALTSL